MKINYNGQELETITEGYWPDGVTLLHSDGGTEWEAGAVKAICLHNSRAFYADGRTGSSWAYWAILPPKPTVRRLTNRELADLCRRGWDVLWEGRVYAFHDYDKGEEDMQCSENAQAVRSPGSDEWVEPTSELLEVVSRD